MSSEGLQPPASGERPSVSPLHPMAAASSAQGTVQRPPGRGLGWLLSAQLGSGAADSMLQIGLLWLLLEVTGSETATGLVAMLAYLPTLLFGLFGGVLVDRFPRRMLLRGSLASRTLCAGGLTALVLLALPGGLAPVVALTFAAATFATVFNPARDSLLPDLVPAGGLLRANSWIQVSSYAAVLLGPAVAAGIVALAGLGQLFLAVGLTLALSTVAVLFVPPVQADGRESGAAAQARRSLVGEFREAARDLLGQPRLRALVVLTAINNLFIMGPAVVGTPIFVRQVLGLDSKAYALIESAIGVGMLLGGLAVSRLAGRLGLGRVLLGGMVFDGLTYALLFFSRDLATTAGLVAFHGLGIPMIVATRTALIQSWVSRQRLGRIFGFFNVAVIGVTAVSIGLTGIAADALGAEVVFGLFGLGAVACGVVGWLLPSIREA